MSRDKKLTPQQEKLLRLIATWPGPELPRLSVLAREMGLAGGSSVRILLSPLVRAGYVEREAAELGFDRLPRVTESGRTALSLVEAAPVVRRLKPGSQFSLASHHIACGPLGSADDQEPEWITDWSQLFNSYRPGDYLLTARGTSMISPELQNESVYPGDRCLARPGIWPSNGEICHVEYVLPTGEHEATLKQFFYNEHTKLVTLKAYNPVYPDIVRSADAVEVHGVVLEVLKCLNRK